MVATRVTVPDHAGMLRAVVVVFVLIALEVV